MKSQTGKLFLVQGSTLGVWNGFHPPLQGNLNPRLGPANFWPAWLSTLSHPWSALQGWGETSIVSASSISSFPPIWFPWPLYQGPSGRAPISLLQLPSPKPAQLCNPWHSVALQSQKELARLALWGYWQPKEVLPTLHHDMGTIAYPTSTFRLLRRN